MPTIEKSFKSTISFFDEIQRETNYGAYECSISNIDIDLYSELDSCNGFIEVIADTEDELEEKTNQIIFDVIDNAKNKTLLPIICLNDKNIDQSIKGVLLNHFDTPSNYLCFTDEDGETMFLLYNQLHDIIEYNSSTEEQFDLINESPLNENVTKLKLFADDNEIFAYGDAFILNQFYASKVFDTSEIVDGDFGTIS